MSLQYAYTLLYVPDVKRSVDFYQQAFGFEAGFSTPEGDYAELQTGAVKLGFVRLDLAKSNLKKGFQVSNPEALPFPMEIAFTVDNIQESFDIALKAGAVLVEAITEKPWGQSVAYLRDPNGFLIELCTVIGSE